MAKKKSWLSKLGKALKPKVVNPAMVEARKKAKAAKKPVSVVKTKGGDYPVYKKESKKAESFRSKFAKSRKAGKKTFTWKGKSYSTKTADDVKKEKATKAPKKVAPKKVAKPAPSGPESPVGKKEYEAKPGQESTMQRNRPKKTVIEPYPPREDQGPKFAEGGKVESNPYGWPSTDARGKK